MKRPPHNALLRVYRLAAGLILALIFFGIFHSVASAQIILDGVINEPDWHVLGTSTGGATPSFGAGHEINALAADMDANYFYIGVAGNVQFGNRILIFIDSMPGGYTNSNFGRTSAPPGISSFNPTSGSAYSQFDDGFTPNYILSISTNNGQLNYFWDLYTLSGSLGSGGGPNLFLGDRNDGDLRANPANTDQTRGFEARLTYSASGSGVDIAIGQSEIRMMAMYINDAGTLSNQFITHANAGEPQYGSGQILFNTAAPNPVLFGDMLVVNEIDYIQPGANVAEFIEIKNITNLPINLDPYELRFARGINSPPEIYRTIDLPNINVPPGSYFVICTNPANVPNCSFTVDPPQDLLENSIPAAVALTQDNQIVDVVSYGGNTGLPYSEGAGVVPTDDGTQGSLGISRIVDGVDSNRNNIDFGLRCVTPGQTNSSQTGGCGPTTPTFTPTLTPTPSSTAQTPTPTGTATPTSTPTPTGSVTATPTGPVTAPPPAGCTNYVVNGDFESSAGWIFGDDPVPGKYTSIPVHAGARSVQLGIAPDSGHTPVYSYSSIRQPVSIPYGATVQLRWWHYYKSELSVLDSTTNTQDRQEVILLRPNGDTLRIVSRVRRNDGAWGQNVVDLTEYAGYSFVLYFNVINYGGGRTWMFVDDVELLVCSSTNPTAAPTLPPGVTATPTPTFTPLATPTFTPSPTTTGTTSGTSVEQNGYGLSALALQNPSDKYSSFNPPQPGQKFVAVEVIVRNISNTAFTSSPGWATLIDSNGFLYPSATVRAEDDLEALVVNPGQAVQGWVGFLVPQESTPSTLRYRFLGADVTLQVGLGGLPVSAASLSALSAAVPLSTEAATPTVTPTNTGAPTAAASATISATLTPTPSPTGTTMSMSPGSAQDALAQQPAAATQRVATATPAFVNDRAAVPEGCIEIVNNGSFEARGMGWSQEGSTILPEYSAPRPLDAEGPQSGAAIQLGLVDGPTVAGVSATEQQVRLPKESTKITLSFRYFALYEAPVSSGDFQFVDIYNGDTRQFIGRVLGVQSNERAWAERQFDLSAFAGETIKLFFMVRNDGVGGNIAMYVDDVSILACRQPQGEPQKGYDVVAQGGRPAGAGPVQPLVAAIAVVTPQDGLIAESGFSFGRIGGLLAVLGIAGAALVLLPLTRRFSK